MSLLREIFILVAIYGGLAATIAGAVIAIFYHDISIAVGGSALLFSGTYVGHWRNARNGEASKN